MGKIYEDYDRSGGSREGCDPIALRPYHRLMRQQAGNGRFVPPQHDVYWQMRQPYGRRLADGFKMMGQEE